MELFFDSIFRSLLRRVQLSFALLSIGYLVGGPSLLVAFKYLKIHQVMGNHHFEFTYINPFGTSRAKSIRVMLKVKICYFIKDKGELFKFGNIQIAPKFGENASNALNCTSLLLATESPPYSPPPSFLRF